MINVKPADQPALDSLFSPLFSKEESVQMEALRLLREIHAAIVKPVVEKPVILRRKSRDSLRAAILEYMRDGKVWSSYALKDAMPQGMQVVFSLDALSQTLAKLEKNGYINRVGRNAYRIKGGL